MLTRFLFSTITLSILFSASQAVAATDDQFNSIQHVGKLNGVALHCKYHQQARRMKLALIAVLPKRRQLGQAFDDATNESFLEFIRNKSECPEPQQFIQEVDAAVTGLNQSFSQP
jgi:hypothetical protein